MSHEDQVSTLLLSRNNQQEAWVKGVAQTHMLRLTDLPVNMFKEMGADALEPRIDRIPLLI